MQNQLLQSGSPPVSVSVLCRLFGVARSTTYYQPRGRHLEQQCDPVCVEAIRAVIEAHPTYGVRMTHARLTKGQGMIVNRKKVHRIMRLHRWTCRQRRTGRRPRVQHLKSIATAPNQRRATDIATVDCGRDGWCAFVPVVDCCSREVLGWELAHTARAKTAERALEEALLHRFCTARGAPSGLTLRHDNGLVFGSRAYRALVRDYGLTQEPERSGDSQPKAARRASEARQYIAPYTPAQNGLCERFIRTFKEEPERSGDRHMRSMCPEGGAAVNAPGSSALTTSPPHARRSPDTSNTTTPNAPTPPSNTTPHAKPTSPYATHPINKPPEHHWHLSKFQGSTTSR